MTGKSFRREVILTMIVLMTASALTLFAGVRWPKVHDLSIGEATRSAIPAYAATGAGWIAFCLQRRIAYIKALQDLWIRLVATIQDTIQYTHLDLTDQPKFALVLRDPSCRTDEMRGVFRNVGEIYRQPPAAAKIFVDAIKRANAIEEYPEIAKQFVEERACINGRRLIGVYPFEFLRQIHDTISRLGFGPTATKERRDIARRTILLLWNILRAELLKELDRDYPEFPDTPYHR